MLFTLVISQVQLKNVDLIATYYYGMDDLSTAM
jgi:hypothetical protein